MAKGYIVAEVDVRDVAAYGEYRSKVMATIEAYGGRFLVRGGAAQALEGAAPAGRLVIIEFPSQEQALAWYNSSAYQAILPIRLGASSGRLLCLTGVESAADQ